MGATFSRLKNWIAEVLTYADLNAEIDNILTNFTPSGSDDYSATATQMRLATDPGESGSESLATSLAGELERIRFAIKEIKGSNISYWYESASSSISELTSALGASVLANRISSGRVRTGSSQPLFLVPDGTARTVKLAGAVTPFVFFYESTQVTISSNVTATSLTVAPSSNNTCLVNMPGLLDEAYTKMLGEYGSVITVDAMGSEISALAGKLAGFRLDGAGTEYFIARVDSATQLSNARRGYFFDSTDAPIPRTAFTDNDTITLMKLTWIFAKSTGVIASCYTNPTVSADEPTSPALGDYWYDTSAQKWKFYNASNAWEDVDGTLIGICLQNTTATVAARGLDFFKNFNALNTAQLARSSATAVVSLNADAEVSVYGTALKFTPGRMTWSTSTDFDSGVSEAASTEYFLYVKESGDLIISDIAPYDRLADLRGLYHPFHTWRCLGQVFNNASQDFVAAIDYSDLSETNFKVTTAVSGNALTIWVHANPLVKFRTEAFDTTNLTGTVQIPCFITLVISSGSTLGHANAVAHPINLAVLSSGGTPYLAACTEALGDTGTFTTTAEGGAGAADSATTIYTIGALTAVPGRMLSTMVSKQTTAGTYATVPTLPTHVRNRMQPVRVTRYTSGSGTHIPAVGARYMRLTMVGGGGGGGGGGTAGTAGNGGNGNDTTFGTSTASAGALGTFNGAGGAGGAATVGAGMLNISSCSGGTGQGYQQSEAAGAAYLSGGHGGSNPIGQGGPGGYANVAGIAAGANSGGGGGGSGGTNAASMRNGGGGGSGGYVCAMILAPDTAGYSYSVGGGGSAGSAGTSGFTGGAGGSGIIIVEEFFG